MAGKSEEARMEGVLHGVAEVSKQGRGSVRSKQVTNLLALLTQVSTAKRAK